VLLVDESRKSLAVDHHFI